MKKQKDKQDESGTEIPGFWERLDSELFKKHGSANEISRKTIVAGYPIGKETIYAIQVKRSMPNTMTFWRLYKTLGINIHYILPKRSGLRSRKTTCPMNWYSCSRKYRKRGKMLLSSLSRICYRRRNLLFTPNSTTILTFQPSGGKHGNPETTNPHCTASLGSGRNRNSQSGGGKRIAAHTR